MVRNEVGSIAHEKQGSFVEVCVFSFLTWCSSKGGGIANVCLFLFIALTPIQDFALQGTPLRSLGISPAILPLFILAALAAGEWLLSGSMIVGRSTIILGAYVAFTALYGLLSFGMWSQGANLLWKGTTILISLAVIIFATQLDYQRKGILRKAIYFGFAVLVVGFLLGNSNPFGLPPLVETTILHYTPLPDLRPRGLSSEPSQFALTLLCFGALSVHMTTSRAGKTLLGLLTFALLVASDSKGAILAIFVCGVFLLAIKWHSNWYQIAGLIFLSLPIGLALVWLIPNLFPVTSFSVSETIPTRFSMIICALITVAHNPLGVGVTGFLPAVARYLPRAISDLESIFPFPLNYGEVSDYLTSADMVSTKSFFFDQLMRFGIPFAIIFFVFIARLLRRLLAGKKEILLVAILTCTIAVITYAPGTGNFAVPILFGVALSEVGYGPNPLHR